MSANANTFVARQTMTADAQRDAAVAEATAIGKLYDAMQSLDLEALEAHATASTAPIAANIANTISDLQKHRAALIRWVDGS